MQQRLHPVWSLHSLVFKLLPKDSHIIAMKGVYGGTFGYLNEFQIH